ncbi:MAG: hypothetical protein ACO3JL_21395 [Myxococcota bacterium]
MGEALVPCCQGLVGRPHGLAARGGEGQERLAVEGPEGGGLVAVVEEVGANAPVGTYLIEASAIGSSGTYVGAVTRNVAPDALATANVYLILSD